MKVARFRIVTYERIFNPEIRDYEWTHYVGSNKDLFIHFTEEITRDMMIDATENRLWFHIIHNFLFFHWDNTRKYINVQPNCPDGVCDWKYLPNKGNRVYYLLKLIGVETMKEE